MIFFGDLHLGNEISRYALLDDLFLGCTWTCAWWTRQISKDFHQNVGTWWKISRGNPAFLFRKRSELWMVCRHESDTKKSKKNSSGQAFPVGWVGDVFDAAVQYMWQHPIQLQKVTQWHMILSGNSGNSSPFMTFQPTDDTSIVPWKRSWIEETMVLSRAFSEKKQVWEKVPWNSSSLWVPSASITGNSRVWTHSYLDA